MNLRKYKVFKKKIRNDFGFRIEIGLTHLNIEIGKLKNWYGVYFHHHVKRVQYSIFEIGVNKYHDPNTNSKRWALVRPFWIFRLVHEIR